MIQKKRQKTAVQGILLCALAATLSLTGCGSTGAYTSAMEAYEAGSYELALSTVQADIAQGNESSKAYVLLGMAKWQQMDYDGAENAFAHSLSLGGSTAEAYRGQGLVALSQGNYEEAVQYFNTALENTSVLVGTMDYDLVSYRNEAYMGLGEYEAVLEGCDVLLELQYHVSEQYMEKGKAYLAMGNTAEADAQFQKAVNRDAGNYQRYIDIYQIFEEYGEADQGKAYLQQALTITGSTDTDALYRGKVYLNLGEYENAIVALNQPLNNQVPEAIVLTGMCYEKMGEYDLALSFYSDHLKLAQDPNVMLRLGYVYAAQGEMTYALETFQQCLENLGDDRTNPVLYYNIAQIYIQQGEYEKALETAAEGNLAYPSDTSLRQTLADLQAYQNSTG